MSKKFSKWRWKAITDGGEKLKVIGITGPIGSGKSYVGDIFEQLGFPRIDTDKVYHGLISKYTETVRELEAEFGKEIVREDGSVDRKKLGEIVFSDKSKLSRLNEITHKYVHIETTTLIEKYREENRKAVIVEVPLMFESGFDKMCDEILCVVADDDVRTERIVKRNGISEKDAKNRIKNQKDNNFYIEKSTIVVYNNGKEDIRAQIEALINKI